MADIKSFIKDELHNTIIGALQPITKNQLIETVGELVFNKISPYFINMNNLVMIYNNEDVAYQMVKDTLSLRQSIVSFMDNGKLIEVFNDNKVGYILKINETAFIWNA